MFFDIFIEIKNFLRYTNIKGKTVENMCKKAVVTLSIDDARENMLPLLEEKLIPLKISATINVVTGFIDGTAENRGYPCVSKEQLMELYKSGLFEIANHGDSHKNTLEDIKKGRDKLIEWLSLDKEELLGFASPGSNMTIEKAMEDEPLLKKAGVSYVRTRDTSFAFDENEGDRHGFLSGYSFAFSSVVVYNGVTPYERLIKLTEYALKKGLTLVLMLHNFAREGEEIYEGAWTYDLDEFSRYIDYLHEKRAGGEVEILKTKDALERLK